MCTCSVISCYEIRCLTLRLNILNKELQIGQVIADESVCHGGIESILSLPSRISWLTLESSAFNSTNELFSCSLNKMNSLSYNESSTIIDLPWIGSSKSISFHVSELYNRFQVAVHWSSDLMSAKVETDPITWRFFCTTLVSERTCCYNNNLFVPFSQTRSDLFQCKFITLPSAFPTSCIMKSIGN